MSLFSYVINMKKNILMTYENKAIDLHYTDLPSMQSHHFVIFSLLFQLFRLLSYITLYFFRFIL